MRSATPSLSCSWPACPSGCAPSGSCPPSRRLQCYCPETRSTAKNKHNKASVAKAVSYSVLKQLSRAHMECISVCKEWSWVEVNKHVVQILSVMWTSYVYSEASKTHAQACCALYDIMYTMTCHANILYSMICCVHHCCTQVMSKSMYYITFYVKRTYAMIQYVKYIYEKGVRCNTLCIKWTFCGPWGELPG